MGVFLLKLYLFQTFYWFVSQLVNFTVVKKEVYEIFIDKDWTSFVKD